jgi:hypothetical protein
MRLYSSQPSILDTELHDEVGSLLYRISSTTASITFISKPGLTPDDKEDIVAILNWSEPIATIDSRGKVQDCDDYFVLSLYG